MPLHRITEPLLPDMHHVVSVDETYHIGEGGRLVLHTVQQELVVPETAAAPLISFSQYVEHGAVTDIQTLPGCLAGDMQPLVAGHPLHIIDFVLDEPLAPGQRINVGYSLWFDEGMFPPHRCCRRVGSNALEHLQFEVQFDSWTPYEAWRGEWTPDAPLDSNSLPGSGGNIELLSGGPDNPDVTIARREDRNLAAGSVVGIEWDGDW